MKMNRYGAIRDQRGAVLVIAIVMLLILSIIGVYAMGSSVIEVKISGQKKFYDVAFNDADGGVQFARKRNEFGTMGPGSANIVYSAPAGTQFNFTATVSYLGNSPPPEGSGTGLRVFKAHYHGIVSQGRDAPVAVSNANVNLEVGGFRIGF